MINETLTRLRSLRLTGMADALNQQLDQPGTYSSLSFEERLALLTEQLKLRTMLKISHYWCHEK